VAHCLYLTTWTLSDGARYHFRGFAAHCPCPVQKRFNVDHDRQERLKPGCQIVGSVTNEWLTTDANSQTSLRRVTMLVGTISDQIRLVSDLQAIEEDGCLSILL